MVDSLDATAVWDLHPDASHPVLLALKTVHDTLDRLPAEQPAVLTGEFHRLVAEADRAIQRLQAVKLRLIAAADAAEVCKDAGLVDTTAWLSRHTRSDSAASARQVSLAQDLESLAATRDEFAHGSVSLEHAQVITATLRQLPDWLSDDQRVEVERKLLRWAGQFGPRDLRRRARQVLHDIASTEEAERHHAETLMAEEQRALAKSRFTLHDNRDGTMSGTFTVPTLAGSILEKVLHQLTAPRRTHHRATGSVSREHLHDWAHQRGLAFTELLEHLPTDRLPHKAAATIVVTIEQRQLLSDLAAAGLDTGEELSPGQVRRLACNAGLLPAVLGGESLPLDLGRTRRLFSQTQRTALATRHSSCLADGCTRPFSWCELHHEDPWARGGLTDLDKAMPLCHHHHRQIHDPGIAHQRLPGGGIRFHRRS